MQRFDDLATKGREEEAKIVYENMEHSASTDTQAFMTACRYGLENLAKYIYKVSVAKKIPVEIDMPFFTACSKGHKAIAKWLIGSKIDLGRVGKSAFFSACCNGHIEIAEWLYGLGEIRMEPYYLGSLFVTACFYGQEKVARWLYGIIEGVDKFKNDAFTCACVRENKQVAFWLHNTGVSCELPRWFIQEYQKEVYDVLEREKGLEMVDKNVLRIIEEYCKMNF